jgi:DNA-binding beta-propeller fold protein YncE
MVSRGARGSHTAGDAASCTRRGVRAVVALGCLLVLLAGGVAYAAIGDLTQKAGTAGCVSDTGTSGACQDGGPLDAAAGVAVSPDGTSVYVATGGLNGDAVVIFDRNPATGTLTQKTGTAGCVSDTGTGGACQDGVALDGVSDVAVSPDGRSVYAASLGTGAVAVFNRNTSNTANRGALTQKADPNDCWSDTGTPATGGTCQNGVALNAPAGVAVSPDGTSVYAAVTFSDAVAIFDRDTSNSASSGTLTQKADPAGCVSETGTSGTCQDGEALDGAANVTVSPDGASVYVTALTSDSVAIFDRATTDAPPPSPPGGGGTGGGGGGTGGGGGDASGDAAPPDTQITDGPKDKVRTSKKRKKVTFEFTSTEAGSTFECSLDGAPFAPCTSPSVEKVKKGKHGFEVRATDPAGNVDPTPATDTWKVKRKRS